MSKPRSVNAVILIADIENSSYYAEASSPAQYNRMIREYHRIASKSVDQYVSESWELEDSILVKRAHGDEILIILRARTLSKGVSYALNLAVLLDVEWSKSRFNSRRIRDDEPPCRLRVGIASGNINMESSVWDQGVTPEGYAIVQTKRIEAAAGGDIHEPHILVDANLRKYVLKLKGVSLGSVKMLHANPQRKINSLEAIRVKSYAGLYNEFKQRLRTSNQYQRWFTRGYQAWSAGNSEESLHAFRMAVKIRPDGIGALASLAGILIHFNQLDEAEDYCRQAISLRDNFATAHTNLGSILVFQKRYKEAIKHYKHAVSLQPDEPKSLFNLGNAYKHLDQYEEAVEAYQQALHLKPDYYKAMCNFAVVKKDLGQFDEAIELVKKAIELEPHEEPIHRLLKSIEDAKVSVPSGNGQANKK
ncbi:tetratricopeptide repeat protein [Calditrichota bacterium]